MDHQLYLWQVPIMMLNFANLVLAPSIIYLVIQTESTMVRILDTPSLFEEEKSVMRQRKPLQKTNQRYASAGDCLGPGRDDVCRNQLLDVLGNPKC